mgnify:CR=1 FL=1
MTRHYTTYTKRVAELEERRQALLTPLQRAYELIERGAPVEAWPEAELNAFCDERPEFARLTDAELDILCADPWPPEAYAIMERLDNSPEARQRAQRSP